MYNKCQSQISISEMSKYKSGYMEFEEASYLSDLFQQIVTDCRVSNIQQAGKLESFRDVMGTDI